MPADRTVIGLGGGVKGVSYAPTSGVLPWGRVTPSMSVATVTLAVPALSSGEPVASLRLRPVRFTNLGSVVRVTPLIPVPPPVPNA